MDDEKRTINGYDIENTIHIGDRAIIYAENLSSCESYMVCNCRWDNPLGIDVYDEAVACTDSLEAMSEFNDRVSAQIQRVRDQRAEHGVSNEPLTVSDCVPGSKNAHYMNQLVVIKPENMIASSRTADEQLLLATNGFGCDPDARGHAVYCKNLFSEKTVRWERSDIAGIIQPERIPEWAHQRLHDMGITVEKPDGPPKVYMATVEEAREKGETQAWRDSWKLNQTCAIRMKDAINDSHEGNYRYDFPSALRAVTAEYGAERVRVVLANSVEYKDYDGRFSRDNKQWAKSIPLPQMTKEHCSAFVCEAHPAILDGFINTARKELREKKPSVLEPLKAQTKQPHNPQIDTVSKKGKEEVTL